MIRQQVFEKRTEKTYEVTHLSLVLHRNGRFAVFLRNLEWPVFDIVLKVRVVYLATDEAFCVKDCVLRVGMVSVLCAVPYPECRREHRV